MVFFGDTLTEANIITYSLWGTMVTRLPQLRPNLEHHAPHIGNLVDRMAQHPKIASFEARKIEEIGLVYCGGEKIGSRDALRVQPLLFAKTIWLSGQNEGYW
jgi:hypothetical protein